MKKVLLFLITLMGFELVGQSAPISKWRLAKEHALGWWDQLRGKYWLSRPANYERNVEPGFEQGAWKKNLRSLYHAVEAHNPEKVKALLLTVNTDEPATFPGGTLTNIDYATIVKEAQDNVRINKRWLRQLEWEVQMKNWEVSETTLKNLAILRENVAQDKEILRLLKEHPAYSTSRWQALFDLVKTKK